MMGAGDAARGLFTISLWAAAVTTVGPPALARLAGRDRFVAVAPGIRIRVLTACPPRPTGAPPLVLIPGWRLAAAIWREQLVAFSGSRCVIALDPRSQGDSTKTPEGDTPEGRAQDLRTVLTVLTSQPVIIVGWSQGVQDVAAYFERFGSQGVRAAILVDAPVSSGASGAATDPQAAAAQMGWISQFVHHPREATEGMVRAMVRKPLPRAEHERLVADALKTPTAIGAAMLADDLLGPDRTPALAKFTVPTLVIASGASPQFAAQLGMAAHLPFGRFEVVDDAGHAVFVDQPERFDALLRAFMTQLP